MPSATPAVSAAIATSLGHKPWPHAGTAVGWFGSLASHVGRRRKPQLRGGVEWLRSLGVHVVDLDSEECASLLAGYVARNPEVWNETSGKSDDLLLGHLSSKTASSNDSGLGSAS